MSDIYKDAQEYLKARDRGFASEYGKGYLDGVEFALDAMKAMKTPAEVIATVIETHKDTIGTHHPECWKYHAGCLAVLLRDLGGVK